MNDQPTTPSPERTGPGGRLPAPLTSFVGREPEIAAVVDLLRDPAVRLVTLTGAGGVGKTRLAIRAAEAVADHFSGGVWFVPLAPLADPTLVTAAIAQVLDLRESGTRTVSAAIEAFLRDRRALLILDNFEHVIAAGPVLADLLATCPLVTCLVTSRTVLRISGEHDVAVTALNDAEALRLFAERARSVNPGFALNETTRATVTDICRRLDRLPLAIELAAARCRLLSPQALLTRLERRLHLLTGGPRDVPSRLRTMRDAIAWSYDLLDRHDQTLFRRLSVFTGGLTLDAAEAVARSTPDAQLPSPVSLFEGISSLAEATLLHLDETHDAEPRYQMLETVREFGLEQLAAAGEEETTRHRHAAWCLALAEQTESKLSGPEQRTWTLRLEREHANLRAALAWLMARGDARSVHRLAGSLWVFWFLRGYLREGYDWLMQALSLDHAASPDDRVQALWGAGMLAWTQGNFDRAEEIGQEARQIAAEHGLVFGTAKALYLLFLTTEMQGRHTEAIALGEAAVARMRESGVRPWLAYVLGDVGTRVIESGDRPRGETWIEEALAIHREFGNKQGLGNKLSDLGRISHDTGDLQTAARQYAESLRWLWEGGDAWYLASPLEGLAAIAIDTGQPEPAARLLGAATALRERSGSTVWPDERDRLTRAVTATRAALDNDAYRRAETAGRSLPLPEVLAEATAVAQTVLSSNTPKPSSGASPAPGPLSPREQDVLRLIAAGHSNPEIATALYISRGTVKTHVVNILAKLDARSRTEAVVIGRRRGLL